MTPNRKAVPCTLLSVRRFRRASNGGSIFELATDRGTFRTAENSEVNTWMPQYVRTRERSDGAMRASVILKVNGRGTVDLIEFTRF